MAQPNLIAGAPNIEGNIGSCTSQEITVVSSRISLWKETTKHIVTNSCTGQVTSFDAWQYTGTAIAVGFVGVILAILCTIMICAVFKRYPPDYMRGF